MLTKIKRFLVGTPLTDDMIVHERITKIKALAVLSSDALSSVAYATEEILIPLAALASAAMAWSIPIGIAIAALLFIVSFSYRQIIEYYQNGGGAYVVAKENLGETPGLVAAAALLIDYVLTVAVSVAAGVENIASAFPALMPYKEAIDILVILIVMVFNLRGVKESATIFAAPTYIFVISIILLIATGFWNLATGVALPAAPVVHEVYPEIAIFILLKSFASGCSALTGVEAISNGVPLFRDPPHRNAKTTLLWMTIILGSSFLGITFLAHIYGIQPIPGQQTAISLLSRAVFGHTAMYYVMQGATGMILLLAANTSYAGFPRLASLLAKDRFLPRQMSSLGDRLVFSNGILGLSVSAMILIVLFGGSTHYLIPLYAVGVFLSFTLAQAGMVVFHLRNKHPGYIQSLLINALGAATTTVVLLVIAIAKFQSGAWVVVLLIPIMVMVFSRIHRHYIGVGKELTLYDKEEFPVPTPLKHTVVIPISGVHKGVLNAVRYAVSISHDIQACCVDINAEATEKMRKEWQRLAGNVPLVILKSPYRSVMRPLLNYIDDLSSRSQYDLVTVLIPEFITAKWYHQFLHNQTAFLIRTALTFRKNVVVTSVRYHLKST